MDYEAMRQALRDCADRQGTGILADKTRFREAISELMPGIELQDERNLLLIGADVFCLGEKLREAASDDESRLRAFQNLLKEITGCGMGRDAAESVLQAFASVLGWEDYALAQLRAVYADKQIGERFEFGSYPQGSNGEVMPITWRVLDRGSESVLAISEYVLDAQPYHKKCCGITWNKSSLRGWINNDFIAKAFTCAERSLIKTSKLSNNAGPSTEDRLFVLSEDEAEDLFADDADRKAKPTDYVAAIYKKAGDTDSSADEAWWRLRSRPGTWWDFCSLLVNSDGTIHGGADVTIVRFNGMGIGSVRPALRLSL
ncbi:hypothetical protein IJT93_02685 [bacterium]|nr:hypothetical protein [bacterium]